jgi:hypothetical protein
LRLAAVLDLLRTRALTMGLVARVAPADVFRSRAMAREIRRYGPG